MQEKKDKCAWFALIGGIPSNPDMEQLGQELHVVSVDVIGLMLTGLGVGLALYGVLWGLRLFRRSVDGL